MQFRHPHSLRHQILDALDALDAPGHIVAAARADPALMLFVGPYLVMEALPATLAAAEPGAREIYAGGWREQLPPGPSRADLVSLISSVLV
jgi:hypothetical protein